MYGTKTMEMVIMNPYQKLREKLKKQNPDYTQGLNYALKWLNKAGIKEIKAVAEPSITSTITGLPSPFKVKGIEKKSLEFKQGFVKKVKEQYKLVKKSL